MRRIVVRAAEVPAADPVAADPHLAERPPVPWQLRFGFVDDAHVDAVDRPPLLGEDCVKPLARQLRQTGLEAIKRAERARLGHAPGVMDGHAVPLRELLDDVHRTRGAADHDPLQRRHRRAAVGQILQHQLPHGRHARGRRHVFGGDQSLEGFRIAHLRAGQHQLRTDHRNGVRQPPCVDVKHGHDRHHGLVHRQCHHVRQGDRVGMQHRRTVTVEHALRMTGRARRVAQSAGGIFVEVRPGERLRLVSDEALVVNRARQVGLRHMPGVRQHDESLDGADSVPQPLEQRDEERVDE